MPRGKFPDSKLNALVRFNVEIIWDQTCLRKLPPAVGAVLFTLLRLSKPSDGVPLINHMCHPLWRVHKWYCEMVLLLCNDTCTDCQNDPQV